jgi:hypothetical protein
VAAAVGHSGMLDAKGGGILQCRRQSMAGKRELIEPNEGDKRYVRRDENGQFTEDQVDVGRSLSADARSDAKTTVPTGQGDRGDTHRSDK